MRQLAYMPRNEGKTVWFVKRMYGYAMASASTTRWWATGVSPATWGSKTLMVTVRHCQTVGRLSANE